MKRLWVVAVVVLAACGGGGSSTPLPPTNPPNTVSPLVTGPPPWPAPTVGVSALASAAGLPMLPREALNEHIHAHLDVFYNGQPVTVPAYLGIDLVAQAISPLHTHDTSGIVHIESPVQKDYLLGQFLTEWGLQNGNGCVASICAVALHVNGAAANVPVQSLVFHAHDEIALVLGSPPASIPSTFAFPSGY